MRAQVAKANLLLLLAALVWGATFVAQRQAMEHMGPLFLSGLRFALGALALLPLVVMSRRAGTGGLVRVNRVWTLAAGTILAGCFMALGINLQQVGLVYTTAGKAGFITGLYVVIVPFLSIVRGRFPGGGVLLGAFLAVSGLYLLSMSGSFTLARGDGWVLACAFAWALQVQFLGWIAPRMDPFLLAFGQAAVCAAVSLALAAVSEPVTLAGILASWKALAFGSIASVAVGFTCQVLGQRHSPPAHAALIMQLEAVFAGLSGWLVLHETMGVRGIVGCLLMLAGMLASQFLVRKQRP
ncbi:MAG: DMT family transporter [Thermodesulfobacteriota bacterium]